MLGWSVRAAHAEQLPRPSGTPPTDHIKHLPATLAAHKTAPHLHYCQCLSSNA